MREKGREKVREKVRKPMGKYIPSTPVSMPSSCGGKRKAGMWSCKQKQKQKRERTEDEGEEEEPENEEEDVHLWICLESVVDLCHHTARTEQG